jgi:hypothetical protein
MVADALRLPTAVGVKVTLTVQLAPETKLAPQPLDCTKSPELVPVTAMLEKLMAIDRLFVRVAI